MDVVLVQPKGVVGKKPRNKSGRVIPPEGLLAVATPLDLAGYKVKIIDQRLDPNWEQTLLAELKTGPICVGTTAMTGPQILGALQASEMVKKNSRVPVVWGGIHATLLPRQTLENPYIDIVVQEEGEETFLELVNALAGHRSIDNIQGISFKTGGVIKENANRPYIDLNLQPLLAYHLIDVNRNMISFAGRLSLPLETSRGCNENCSFCYNTRFHRNKWRYLSADETINRIRYLKENYKIQGIVFRDDNFFASPERSHQILEGMVRNDFNITWGKGDIKLNVLAHLDDDYLRLIQKSRCTSLIVGIESGSQRIADLIKKRIDISDAIPVNRRMAKFDMDMYYLFLTGIPGETKADLQSSAALGYQLTRENPNAALGVQKYVPYPGTELFDSAVKYGLFAPQKLEDWIPYGWVNRGLNFPWLSPDHLKMIKMISFCSIFQARKNALDTYLGVSPAILMMAKLYSPAARARFKGMHYKFFPELKIAEMLGYKGY
jgi:anaerobic magnesium-protoporphyrin IX monomethyl ester cyclase